MRLLFVSSTTVGGSGRSQRELATRLLQIGHDVTFLVDDGAPARARRWAHEQLSDLAVRLDNRPGGRLVRAFERRPGRRTRVLEMDGFLHVTSPIPQNALEGILREARPDVVVGNSLVRLSWRRIRSSCERRGIPTVLYIREEDSLDHLVRGEEPNAVVANAEALRAAAEQRGFVCSAVPSVIDVERTRTKSTRKIVLVVNPIESRGVATVWKVAAALPDIPFVIQESWPLDPDQLAVVERRTASLTNVEFRRAIAPGPSLYRDARLLVVPYRVDNRPRVIAEAQANGIPVVASNVPALREAIGNGGLVVDLDNIDQWCDTIRALFTDEGCYEAMAAAALRHSKRAEIDPASITAMFERILIDALGTAERGRQ